MADGVESTAEGVVLDGGAVSVAITLRPLSFELRRGGRRIVRGGGLWLARGSAGDHFVQLTEGVIPHEDVEEVEELGRAEVVERHEGAVVLVAALAAGGEARIEVALAPGGRVMIALECPGAPLRLGVRWERRAEERLTGLGARHGLHLDQAGRRVWLGADRRYTGPDCPADMLEVGGIPQGDYAPAPFLLSSRGYAVWAEASGPGTLFDLSEDVSVSARGAAGALRVHLFTDPTPAACLRRYCRLTGMPALLPEWGYGHWKSRDVYPHQRDVEDD
ncbi:MAG: hypothetical protein H0V55_05715, partial [Thermoleophilaceae bacterium]|nr:hypothetical protein [Thermoleophilaceae bacterium]